jgi:pimeloyl-ACP methyl ester carboxylesterase
MRLLHVAAEVGALQSRPRLTCLMLHGLLGSGIQWLPFCKRLASHLPDWRFVMLDLRNHGS